MNVSNDVVSYAVLPIILRSLISPFAPKGNLEFMCLLLALIDLLLLSVLQSGQRTCPLRTPDDVTRLSTYMSFLSFLELLLSLLQFLHLLSLDVRSLLGLFALVEAFGRTGGTL